MPVYLLSEQVAFPAPDLARKDGLLAAGGDLSTERLLLAYEQGIFPWYSDGDPILWWSPDPRFVLFPQEIRISKSLRKTIRQKKFDVRTDTAFAEVITACSAVSRKNQPGTWIVNEMIEAYTELFRAGFAHSVEAWRDGKLVGGLYGVSLGGCFFGESMFAHESNASKVAFAVLVEYLNSAGFDMIDCQIPTGHLERFGAKEIPRSVFLGKLRDSVKKPTKKGRWRFPSLGEA